MAKKEKYKPKPTKRELEFMLPPKRWKVKADDHLYLIKPNKPMGLHEGDLYGKVIEVTEGCYGYYIVKRVDDEIFKYRKANADDVFFRWFTNQNESEVET